VGDLYLAYIVACTGKLLTQRRCDLKKLLVVFALAAISTRAADWTGYVIDKECSGSKERQGDIACAQRCISRGSPAVLVTEDGHVYKIANQDKVTPHAGRKVTISGSIDGDTIKVESVQD
jgi:hypothetical protein